MKYPTSMNWQDFITTEEQILADFPALKPEHIRAALAFAAEKLLFDENLSFRLVELLGADLSR